MFLDLIRADHDRIVTLFDMVMQSTKNEKKRKDIFGELRREITRHSMLEEEVLYPRLKGFSLTGNLARCSVVQHAAADRMINTLESTTMGTANWEKTLRQLHEIMVDHMKLEETELKVLAPKVFSQVELVALLTRLRTMRAA